MFLLLLLAAAVAAFYLYSQSPPQPITSTPGDSYLIILGTQDKAPTLWAGGIKVTGSTILAMDIWRRGKGDSSNVAKGSFVVNTRKVTGVVGNTSLPENGVILTVAPQTSDITFGVGITHKSGVAVDCTANPQLCFSFKSSDVPFGAGKYFLGGSVYVARTASTLQLTKSLEEQDFPAIARSGDDVWVSYVQFVHGDRTLQQSQGFKNGEPTWAQNGDFGLLARTTGGDQVFAMHYSISSRTWTGPFAITAAGEDVMRTAVAIDGQGRAWVFYSTQRSNNFDLYAKRVTTPGVVSAEVRITTLPGTDLNPVATTDSTGRVWVAWQAFRATNLQILAAVQPTPSADTIGAERVVSTSPANNWDPAIAAGANGEVAISWDTYDKGDYDVYVRKVTANVTGAITMVAPQPVAASLGFEAHSSIAYDPQGRLWIAYETADQKWGKDFATLITTGINIYQNHNIAVRCLDGTAQYATTADLTKALPGPPPARLFQTNPPAAKGSFPNPGFAPERGESQAITAVPDYPVTPLNSLPRLAIDSDGTLYLAFRTKAGSTLSTDATTGSSVGSIWLEQMVYFDGAKWNSPGIIAQSDGLLDNRPAMLAVSPGHLLIAQAMDHRLSPPNGSTLANDTVNSDIYAAELNIQRTQQAAQLTPSPAVIAAQSQDEKDEAAQAALMNNATVQTGTGTYHVVRGDFHRHTELSFDGGGDGSLPDAYRYMIDAAPLQWGGCCDHDNGSAREYSWWILQKYTEAYFLSGRYTPMFNYERSVAYPDGHRNALFARRGVRPLPRIAMTNPPTLPSPDTLLFYQYLKFFGGLDAAHSTATDQGTNWNANDPTVETTVEIYQGARQSYEMPESPRANSTCDSIDTFESDGFVSVALAKGYVLGFESSSDHRSTHVSYANVWTTDTTRQGILDALSKRRTYASTDLILADVRIGDHFMGEDFPITAAPTLSVTLKGTAPFVEVVVVKDGNIVYTTSGPASLSFTYKDSSTFKSGQRSYYYVRGLQQGPDLQTFSCESYKRTQGAVVWTSPTWVTMQ
jgi:hypothetical protein